MGSRVVLSESLLPTPRGWGGVVCTVVTFCFCLLVVTLVLLGMWLEREVAKGASRCRFLRSRRQ